MTDTMNLIEQLNTGDTTAQADAAEKLASLAEEAQPAIIALVQHCASEDEDVCNLCTAALESVGPPALDQIDELTLMAQSASQDIAFWAITLLGRAGKSASSAAAILTDLASNAATPALQKRATWALGKIE